MNVILSHLKEFSLQSFKIVNLQLSVIIFCILGVTKNVNKNVHSQSVNFPIKNMLELGVRNGFNLTPYLVSSIQSYSS